MAHTGNDHADPAVLYDTYGRAAYSLAKHLLKDSHLAQDVVQDVFLAVYSDPSRFDGPRGSLSSWLLAMTHHKAVDVIRREEVRCRHLEGMEVTAAGDGRASSDHDVHEQVCKRLRSERLRQALQELPSAQRQALLLAYFEGYSQQEIAALTNASFGTVKTRMHHGMRRLHALLYEPR